MSHASPSMTWQNPFIRGKQPHVNSAVLGRKRAAFPRPLKPSEMFAVIIPRLDRQIRATAFLDDASISLYTLASQEDRKASREIYDSLVCTFGRGGDVVLNDSVGHVHCATQFLFLIEFNVSVLLIDAEIKCNIKRQS